MEVATRWSPSRPGPQGPFAKDAPQKPIVIKSARRKA